MTDFRINVIIDPSSAKAGSRVVEKELVRIGDTADRVRTTLARAFKIIGIAKAIQEVGDLADAYIRLQNRLRVVVDGNAALEVTTQRLLDVSNRSRSSFEATAELYSRVALATKTLGTSQTELLGITESINKAIILSGASAKEANNGLIQLSQGIAANRLGGDELRSILEQLPVVADVIARELKITRGELKALGAEGGITGEVVIRAFRNAREEIEGKFAKTIPTVGQGFQILRNNLLVVVGEFDKAVGASRALSAALVFLANNLKTIVQLLLTLGSVFAAIKLAPFIARTLAAAQAYLDLRKAVASGNAVILSSAEAIRQKAAFEAQNAAASVASAQAALSAAKAEQARIIVTYESTAAAQAQAQADLTATAAALRRATAANAVASAENARLLASSNALDVLQVANSQEATLAAARATLAAETNALAAAQTRLDASVAAGNTAAAIRIQQDARLVALEATLTAETNALAAANTRLAAANTAAAAQSTLLGRAFVSIKAGITSVTAAIAANPIGAALVALTAIIAPLVIFRNEITLSQGKLATLGDFLTELGDRVSTVFSTAADIISETVDRIADSFPTIFGDLEFSFAGFLRFMAKGIDFTFAIFTALGNSLVTIFSGIGPALGDLAIQAINTLIGAFEFGIDAIVASFSTLGKTVSRFLTGIIQAFTQAGIAIKAAVEGNFDDAINASKKAGEAIFEGTLGAVRDVPDTFLNELTKATGDDLIPKLNNAFVGEAKLFGASVADSFVTGLTDTSASDFVESLLGGAEARAQARKAAEDAAKAASNVPGSTPAGTPTKDPFGDLLAELRQQEELLSLINVTNREREIEAELLRLKNQLIKDGVNPTEAQIDQLRVQLTVNQSLQDQIDLINELRGPEEERQRQLDAANAAFDRGAITAEEYAKALSQIEEAGRSAFDNTVRDLEQQNAVLGILGQSNSERAAQVELQRTINELTAQGEMVSDTQVARLASLIAANQSLQRQNELLEELTPLEEQLALKQQTANEAFARGAITGEQYAQVLRDIQLEAAEAGNSITDGFTTGFAKVQDQLTDLASVTENALVNAFSAAEDALVEFATTGKFSFREFASGIIKDILRIISRMLLLQAIQSVFPGFGAAAGAAGAAGGAVGAMAEGGYASANKPYLVGEEGPELFVPNASGNVIPHDQTVAAMTSAAAAQAGTTVVSAPAPIVNLTVVNQVDAGEIVDRGLSTPRGERSLVNNIGKNKDTVKRRIS